MKLIPIALLIPALAACRPAPVPVSEEPHHRLVYSSDIVHVMDIRIGAGETTLYHIHAHPLVVVHVRNTRNWDQTLGNAPAPIASPEPAPEVTDNWSRAQPYTHRVGNADSIGIHYVAAEWLKSSGVVCDSLPETPTRRLVKSGPTALVYAVTIPPHDSIATHSHSCPGLTVAGTDGQWAWHAPSYDHSLQNPASVPMIVYEIDWR